MHEPLLARAALPAPVRILGLVLRPYSVGHELFLIRETSEHAAPGIGELCRAVWICAHTWDENRLAYTDPLARFKLWVWRKRLPKYACFPEALSAFVRYRINGSLEFPPSEVLRTDRPGSDHLIGSPFLLRLQQFLMLELGFSESQAWDYPYGLAKCRWAAWCEEQGHLDIYNAQEEEFDAYCRRKESEAKRRKGSDL